MSISCLFFWFEVEFHFHESIVSFSWIKVNVARIFNRLLFYQRLTSFCLLFSKDFEVTILSVQETKHCTVMIYFNFNLDLYNLKSNIFFYKIKFFILVRNLIFLIQKGKYENKKISFLLNFKSNLLRIISF